jgi:hypothetical protein
MFIMHINREGYDDATSRFTDIPICDLKLEHSLLSLSKWESIWEVPFFSTDLNSEQTLSYIEQCILNDYDPDNLKYMSQKNLEDFSKYIERPMTAKKFYDLRAAIGKKNSNIKSKSSITTSEDLYYDMITFHIWKECETWPLPRLLALIQVFANRNNNQTMSKKDLATFYREENERRLAKYNSKG